MGMFTNFKINSLRKMVEDKYESKLELLVFNFKNSMEGQQLLATPTFRIILLANVFAKKVTQLLFQPDSGIFKDDISKLNENRFDLLYQIIIIWYSWVNIPFDSEGRKDLKVVNFSISCLENGFGIDVKSIKLCYDGYTGTYDQDVSLRVRRLYAIFYKNCMLSVGHIDRQFDTIPEDSPDFMNFLGIIGSGLEGIVKEAE